MLIIAVTSSPLPALLRSQSVTLKVSILDWLVVMLIRTLFLRCKNYLLFYTCPCYPPIMPRKAKISPATSQANIKLESTLLDELKALTEEQTGQRAVNKALIYFIREARQRDLLKFLSGQTFRADFDPLALRADER